MNKGFFLDRDGTVVVEKNYLRDPEQVVLEKGAAQAIRKMSRAGFKVIIITNQSGIARGYFSEDDVWRVNRRVEEMLARAGTKVDAFYYCPHHPRGVVPEYSYVCSCRKPEPGLILKAMERFDINPALSFMAGDRESDLTAGLGAGCRPILVRTGYGGKTEAMLKNGILTVPGLLVFDNLLEMVNKVIPCDQLLKK